VCQPDCTGAVCGGDGCGGSCGSCPGSEVCQNGQCVASCDPGYELCGQDCVDTSADPQHCGGCDQPCDPAESCGSGVCEPVGGADAGVGSDGGTGGDGGVTSDASPDGRSAKGGCGCETGTPASPGGLVGLLLVLLALGRRFRHRA
jgi:MYXO-CTERM domain-containing protein